MDETAPAAYQAWAKIMVHRSCAQGREEFAKTQMGFLEIELSLAASGGRSSEDWEDGR